MSAASTSTAMTPAEAIEAFIQAAYDGDLATATAMLEEGKVELNTRNSNGGTALMWASKKGYLDLVRYLLGHGADVDLASDQGNVGWTALHAASQEGHFKVCRLLLAMGANVNAKDKDQETPLHRAAFEGHTEICRELVEEGSNVEARDRRGRTPLMLAAEKGHAAVCECLVKEAKANINAVSNTGETALDRASFMGRTEVVKVLLETSEARGSSGAVSSVDVNVADKRGRTPLMSSCRYGYQAIAEILLAHGAKIDARDNDDWDAFHDACHGGHVNLCRRLLSKGADVHSKLTDGSTALHQAARGGNRDIISMLLQLGLLVDAADETGWTPLLWTCQLGHLAACTALLDAGADADPPLTSEEWSPFTVSIAAAEGHFDICRLLIERGADVRCQDNSRRTALYEAAKRAHAEVCKLILAHGAEEDLFVFSKFGDRPLDLARKIAKSATTYLFLLDRMVLLRGHDEPDREAEDESSRDFFSSALQSFLAPSFDPLPVHRSLIQWLRFSPVAARMQEEWPPTAHNWQDLDTKAKRLVAYREDAWQRRKHLVLDRELTIREAEMEQAKRTKKEGRQQGHP